MAELREGTTHEANKFDAFFLNLFGRMGGRSRERAERRADRERAREERRAARALATGATKKGGRWERFGSPTLGGACAAALLGAFHGGEWLKKWVWGKNRAYWNSIIPAAKGMKLAV